MRALSLVFLVAMTIVAQTSDSFRRTYGPPISETFVVREGVLATFEYAKDGQVCRVVITSEAPVTKDTKRSTLFKKIDVDGQILDNVANEVAPPNQRGKPVSTSLFDLTSADIRDSYRGVAESYEHVRIESGYHGNHREVTVSWKARKCQR
jgi:hypothetical protein